MKNILITGASGNIGQEVIRGLYGLGTSKRIIAADRNPQKAMEILVDYPSLEYRKLDFSDPLSFDAALEGISTVFLLRPPQLADVPKYFEPFVDAMLSNYIREIVFLSVQGVENQKGIPHHKIEKLIQDRGLDYVFLRPSYFMQNLTTTLLREIKEENKIFIPSGSLEFTWVDVRDIGLVGAQILNNFQDYSRQAPVITGSEQKDFHDVASMLSRVTGRSINYESPGLMKFFRAKRKEGMQKMMIFVMIMLHYLPRFSKKKNELTDTVLRICGREPGTLEAFMEREKEKFQP